jgi:hypothetical protein
MALETLSGLSKRIQFLPDSPLRIIPGIKSAQLWTVLPVFN